VTPATRPGRRPANAASATACSSQCHGHYLARAILRLDNSAGHRTRLGNQFAEAGAELDRHAVLTQSVEGPGDKRVAHDQPRAAALAQVIHALAQDQGLATGFETTPEVLSDAELVPLHLSEEKRLRRPADAGTGRHRYWAAIR
jgi:hypothetical protein